jgi:Uma2 family endonuclease
LYKVAPCLIAEVLSPSTEVIDRREKLIAYRTLEALRYYLLVAQDAQRVELYERQDDGSWVHTIYEAEGDLEFRCGGLHIRFSLAEIYEDVVFS